MKGLLLIFTILFIFSCNNDVEDITVYGVVKSEETNEPVNDVDVSVICWRYGESRDESYTGYETKLVSTNDKGEYKVHFERGTFIEVKVELEGNLKAHEAEEINSKNVKIDLLLKK